MTEQERGVAHHVKDLAYQSALYRMEPPVEEADERGEDHTFEHVIVMSRTGAYGPETVIYPGNSTGHVTLALELAGTFRGGLSHAEALDLAGYELADD